MTAANNLPSSSSFLKLAQRLLVGLGLLSWAWLWVDLVLHPIAAGPNEGGPLFRWASALVGSATIVTALFIMRRVPGNMNGLLLFFWGLGSAGWSIRSEWADPRYGLLAQATFGIFFMEVATPAAVLMLLCFPDGKPYPIRLQRWLPAITVGLVIVGSTYIFGFQTPPGSPVQLANPFFIPVLANIGVELWLAGFIGGMSGALVTLVLRYRSGGERLRLQLKWMIWLLVVAIVLTVVPNGKLTGPFYLVGLSVKIASFLFWQGFLALATGIAVLRHNLWGIDLLIRRTLIYSLLTVLLGLVYFGGVTLLQSLFVVVTGQQSPAAVVISTLLIAALVSPLRKRIQDFIDRRFYRRKYDAERVLARFAAAARHETDLEHLSTELRLVVQETIQPQSTGLWLKGYK